MVAAAAARRMRGSLHAAALLTCEEPRIPVRILLDISKSMETGKVPKFDYARKLAAATGVPLKEILAAASHEYLKTR